jgi:hypothetical protein
LRSPTSNASPGTTGFALEAVLEDGAVKVDLRRGRFDIRIDGPGATVALVQGRARIEVKGDTLTLGVYAGQLRIVSHAGSAGKPIAVGPGRKARVRNGYLQGEIAALEYALEPW